MIIEGPANINAPSRPKPITEMTKYNVVPERSGNTQTQVTVFGGTPEGGAVDTTPVGVSPAAGGVGVLKLKYANPGVNGVIQFVVGNLYHFTKGRLMSVTDRRGNTIA